MIRARKQSRQSRWDRVNAMWFEHYPLAVRFYSEILKANPNITVMGLIEDGMLEEAIEPSVKLFSETLWNPQRPPEEILQKALAER
jgi:hypothetical protein